nr:EOG090X03TW [Eulimnadia texana]
MAAALEPVKNLSEEDGQENKTEPHNIENLTSNEISTNKNWDNLNGSSYGLEVAVEALPDAVYHSPFTALQSPSNGQHADSQPRVYLEKESIVDDLSELSLNNEFSTPALIRSISNTPSVSSVNIEDEADNNELHCFPSLTGKKKHVFILSEAGKPIYSRYENEEDLVTLFGVMQALVSFIEDSDDMLESIYTEDTTFVFLHKPPLILVIVSKLKDNVMQLKQELVYVYNQILSVITLSQLERIFKIRQNYDLRRLLAGSERIMDSLINYIDNDWSVMLGAVKFLPMASNDRDAISQTISQNCNKIKDVIFALLIGKSQLISFVRMKKHFLEPEDLHLLINFVNSSETFKTAEGWTPICLPRFDSSGFLYAHVSYLSDDCQSCLVFLTTNRDSFFALSEAKQKIVEKMRRHNMMEVINRSLYSDLPQVSQLGLDELRHFIYRSKVNSQYTCTQYSVPYHTDVGHNYLFDLYRFAHGRMHHTSRPLKVMCYSTSREILLGWVTAGFELFAVMEPLTTKASVMNIANGITKWIKKEEDFLFNNNTITW